MTSLLVGMPLTMPLISGKFLYLSLVIIQIRGSSDPLIAQYPSSSKPW